MTTNDKTTTITVVEDDLAPTQYTGTNRGQLNLLKRTLAKGTTDDEFALFMNTANRLGIDPFARQIYAVKRYSPDEGKEVMAIQIGIDGFRAIAEATDDYQGQEGPFWCGEDGVWRDAWISDKPPAAAKVIIYRKGIERGFAGTARYRSFVQTKKDGSPVRMWLTMPDVMLAKCAEAQALRKAFPRQLSGVQTDDEMGQADREPVSEAMRLPTAATASTSKPAAEPTKETKAKEPADVWPVMLADLAKLETLTPELAANVVGKADVSTWDERDIEAAVVHLLAEAQDGKACAAVAGTWGNVLSRHASASQRVALVRTGCAAAYNARLAEIKKAASS